MGRLTEEQIRSAADMLVALREDRLVLAGLPPEVTPDNTADVQRIIDAVSGRVDRAVRGWKTYTVYKPMNPPFYAPIYDVFASGAEIPAGISPHRLIEPEIMFRVDRDLPPRARNYDIDEIMDSVTGVVGFEVIGSRFTESRAGATPAGGQGSLYGSFSDHIANGGIVVGDAIRGLARRRLRRRPPPADGGRQRADLGRRLPPLRQPVPPGRRGRQPVATPSGCQGRRRHRHQLVDQLLCRPARIADPRRIRRSWVRSPRRSRVREENHRRGSHYVISRSSSALPPRDRRASGPRRQRFRRDDPPSSYRVSGASPVSVPGAKRAPLGVPSLRDARRSGPARHRSWPRGSAPTGGRPALPVHRDPPVRPIPDRRGCSGSARRRPASRCCARRRSSSVTLETPMWRIFPWSFSSASAPTDSS